MGQVEAPTNPSRAWLYSAAAGLGVVLLCAASAGGYVSATRWVDHTLDVRQAVYEWSTALRDVVIAAHTFVTSGQVDRFTSYKRALTEERRQAAVVRSLVAGNATQRTHVEAADHDALKLTGRLRELVSSPRDRALAQLAAGDGTPELEAFRQDVLGIRAEEDRLLTDRRAEADARGWLTLGGALLLVLTSSGFLLLAWRQELWHRAVVTRAADESRDRLETLSRLATSLSDVRTCPEVAAIVVEQGLRAARADAVTLHLASEDGTALELIGDRGFAPSIVEAVRTVTETSALASTFAAFQSRTSTWVESASGDAVPRPGIGSMNGRKAAAFWSVPLVAEDRSVGLLSAGFNEPRSFSQDERAFIQTLASLCAQALLRASRLEHEEEGSLWLETTLRSIGDAVIATDIAGRVRFMNPVAEALTGWPVAEARGRPLGDVFAIFSERTREPAESPVAEVLREGISVGLANHTVLRTKLGVDVPIDDSGAPIRTAGGRIVGVVLVFRDATQQKRAQVRSEFLTKAGEVLGALSVDYEAALATVADLAVPPIADWCAIELAGPPFGPSRRVAIAHVDPERVAFARRLAGRYPPDPNARMGVPEVIRTGKPELYTEISPELLGAAAWDTEHLRLLRELRIESALVVPLRSRGRTYGAISFAYAESGRRYTQDDMDFAEDFARRTSMAIENALAVQEAEEAREKERWLRDEAEFANQAKDEFLATVSHELRTPLNAILSWAVMLHARGDRAMVERGLTIIERNARTQAKLIDDILDVSRIIAGKLTLNLAPTNVRAAVSAAIEAVSPAAAAKGIPVDVDVSDHSLVVMADPDRLQQVVWNLVSNAVKFTPKGGRVNVSAQREGSDVCLRVIDTGEGIEPGILPLIFERFRQADASTTRRHGGLGLGLAIVKHLVSAHGGSVRAESEGRGKGATFVVRLPARLATRAVAEVAQAPDTADTPASAAGPRLDGLRLLVVDDEPDAREVVGEVLRQRGADVQLAASAAEAMDRLSALRPDVIVSDIGMPEADGYSLIRKIRALPAEAGGGTPAVALTAYARTDDARRAFAAGFQLHVAKPVEPAQLAVAVAKLGGIGPTSSR